MDKLLIQNELNSISRDLENRDVGVRDSRRSYKDAPGASGNAR